MQSAASGKPSVHFAAPLEQQASSPARAAIGHHAAAAGGTFKPCLKPQPRSFPFLEEVVQLEGLMRRPPALLLGPLSPDAAAAAAAAKKRSRLAAFGQ